MAKNSALENLLQNAANDGVLKNAENSKSNIYQEKFFEGVTSEKEEKSIRRKLRDTAFLYLASLASAKDKKSFDASFAKFKKFYSETYTSQEIDLSIFDAIRADRKKSIIDAAKLNVTKFNK